MGCRRHLQHLVEGLQDAEKIWQLRNHYRKTGDKSRLARLNKKLAEFTPANMTAEKERNAGVMVRELERLLNE